MNTKIITISILLTLVLIALNTSLIILAYRASDNIGTSKSQNISDMGSNWSFGPISAFTDCSGGDILTDAFWYGTVAGCLKNNGELIRGDCPKGPRNTETGSPISEIDPVRLLKWKGIDFCGKTLGNYLSLNIIPSNENCPAGTKKCGTIDSLDNILCVEANSDCPITSIKLSSAPPSTTESSIAGDNIYLAYSKEPSNSNIPVQFKVSEGKICSDLTFRDIKRNPYIMETFAEANKCRNTLSSSIFNEEFISLDIHQLSALYEENKVIEIIANLTQIDVSEYNTPVYLLTRPFIGLTKECRDILKEKSNLLEEIKSAEKSTDDAEDFLGNLKFACLLLCPINIILALLVSCCSFKKLLFLISTGVSSILSGIFYFILLIMGIIAKVKVDDSKLGIGFISENSCSDSIINESVQIFVSNINNSSIDLLTFVLLDVACLIVFFAGTGFIMFIIKHTVE